MASGIDEASAESGDTYDFHPTYSRDDGFGGGPMAGVARLRPVWASKVLIHASAPSGRPVLEARLRRRRAFWARSLARSAFYESRQ